MKYTIKFSLFHLLIIIYFSWSCQRDLERGIPRILTEKVTEITSEQGVEDHGFVWGTRSRPQITNAETVRLGPREIPGNFSSRVSSTLESGKTYHVRAFVRQGGVVYYGNDITFVSLGSGSPQLLNIEPANANLGDTISLSGLNFSRDIEKTKVRFGNMFAEILSSSGQEIITTVPHEIDSSSLPVSISFLENWSNEKMFHLNPPVIDSISSLIATTNEHLQIFGRNLVDGYIEVYLDTLQLNTSIFVSDKGEVEHLTSQMPAYLNSGKYSMTVQVFDSRTNYYDSIEIKAPEVLSFSPRLVNIGDTVSVHLINVDRVGYCYLRDVEAGDFGYLNGILEFVVPEAFNSNSAILEINTRFRNIWQDIYSKDSIYLKEPQIDSISTNLAFAGNVVNIYGSSFTPLSEIEIGGLRSEIISTTSRQISFYVPLLSSGNYSIKLISAGYETEWHELLKVQPPELISLDKYNVQPGDTLTLSGHFSDKLDYLRVTIDDQLAPFTSDQPQTKGKLKVTVPRPDFAIEMHSVTLQTADDKSTLNNVLNIKKPTLGINSLQEVGFKDTVEVLGEFPLDLLELDVAIMVAGRQYRPFFIEKGRKLGFVLNPALEQGLYSLELVIGEFKIGSEEFISVPWRQTSSYEHPGRYKLFQIANEYYMIQSSDSVLFELKKFDLNTSTWQQKGNIEELKNRSWVELACMPFEINDKGYFLFRVSDSVKTVEQLFYEYDPVSDKWSSKTTPPSPFSYGYSFSLNGRGFVGTGRMFDRTFGPFLFEYHPSTDSWTKKSDPPYEPRVIPTAFEHGDYGYIWGGAKEGPSVKLSDMWQYDPTTDSWMQKKSLDLGDDPVVFTSDQYVYAGSWSFYRYDPLNDIWNKSATTSYYWPDPNHTFQGWQFDTYVSWSAMKVGTSTIVFGAEAELTTYPNFSYKYQTWEFKHENQ